MRISHNAARRIIKNSRSYERSFKGSGLGSQRTPRTSSQGFYAKITDRGDPDTEEEQGRYSWKQLEFQDHELEENEDNELLEAEFTDDKLYAVEVHKSLYVPKESLVWMRPSLTGDYFVFELLCHSRLGRTTTTIPAMDGEPASPASADVDIYGYVDGVLTLVDTVKAFNMTETDIDEDAEAKMIQVKFIEGYWFVDVESCPA